MFSLKRGTLLKSLFFLLVIVIGIFCLGFYFVSGDKNTNTVSLLGASDTILNPVNFGLPATAKEVPEKRTERSATFEISPGHFAAVSGGGTLFVRDEHGKFVIADIPSREKEKSQCDKDAVICFLKSFFHKIIPFAFASSSGPNSPGTVVDNNDGSNAWSNPSNATASDGSYATAVIGDGDSTNLLKATNFGFSVPGGASIDGVIWEAKVDSTNHASDNSSVLVINDSVDYSSDAGSTFSGWSGEFYHSWGESDVVYGSGVSASDVNATGFGFAVSAYCTSEISCTGSGTEKVDHMRMTVYYSSGSAAINISGTVYTDEGTTTIGSGRTVGVSVNGAAPAASTTTASNGTYTLSGVTVTSSDVLTLYLDGATEKGVTVTTTGIVSLTGVNIYQNDLIVRSETATATTNTGLDTADNNGDTDISSLYSVSSGNVTVASGKNLFIATGTYAPGGNVTVNGNFTNNGAYTKGTETVTLTGTGSQNLKGGSSGFYNLTINGSGGTYTLQGALTVTNTLTITAGTLDTKSGSNFTVNAGIWSRSGTFTVRSATLSITGTGTFADTMSFYNFDINGSGKTVTLGAALTVTNNLTISAGTLDVSAAGCSAASCSITVGNNITKTGSFTARTGTVTLTATSSGKAINNFSSDAYYDLTFNGVGGDWASNFNTALTVSHVLTIANGNLTLANSDTVILSGTGTPLVNNGTITPGNNSVINYTGDGSTTIAATGYANLQVGNATTQTGGRTYTLGGDITVTGTLTVGPSTGSNTQTLDGSSYTITLSNVVANVFTMQAHGSYTAGTSTIKILNGSTTDVTFAGGGATYNNIWFNRSASTGSITITGSNTFNDFKDTGTAAHSILFTHGTTTTVTTFSVSGSAGNLITINSDTTATHTLTKAGGGVISRDYLSIQHSVATPSSTWYAGTHSTNNQATSSAGSGWAFSIPASSVSGTVYSDEGTTNIGTGKTVAISIGGAAAAATVDTDSGGAYSLTGLTISGGDVLTLYLDGETEKAVTVTVGSGVDLTGINLYQNDLITRCDNSCSLRTASLLTADNNGDTDISSIYSTSSNNLVLASGKNLFIPSSHTFDPEGDITLTGNFTNNGTYLKETSTININGTGTQTIKTNGSQLYNLTQNGSGGTYTLQDALSVSNNLTITAGTLDVKSGSNYGVTVGGTWSRSGTFTPRTGILTLTGTSTFADTMSFYDITINGSTKTITLGAALTATHTLTITAGTLDTSSGSNYAVNTAFLSVGASGTFVARASTVTLSGTSGTLFTNSGTFTAGTSTVTFTPDAAVTVLSGTFTGSSSFYNIIFSPSLTNNRAYTLGTALTVGNNVSILPGDEGSGLRLTVTMSGALVVTGDISITGGSFAANSTLDTNSGSNYPITAARISITGLISSGTLTANASVITLTGTSGTLLTRTNNGVFTQGTSEVVVTSASGTPAFFGTAITFHKVTINSTATVINQGGSALTINNAAGAAFTITSGVYNAGAAITGPGSGNGTLTISSGATLCLGGTTLSTTATCDSGATQASAISMPTFQTYSFNAASTVSYLSNAAQTVSVTPAYGNLKFIPVLTSGRTYTMASGAATINGDFTSNPNGGASARTLTVTMAGAMDLPATKTITISGNNSGVTSMDTTSGSSYALTAGFLNLASGSTLTANGSTITLTGTSGTLFTNGGTFTAGTSTVVFSGNGDAALTSTAATFNAMTSSGTGTKTLGGTTVVGSNLTISAGTLDAVNGQNYSISVAGNWSNSGAFTPRSGTVTFNGSSGQALTGETFYNLTINNSAASPSDSVDVDSSAAVTVTNTLTVTDGQFQPTTASSFKDITITTNGILKPDSSASISLTGNWSNTGTFTANSGTVTFNGNSGQTLTGETFSSLTINNSAASPSDSVDVDSSAAVTVINTLTVSDGQFQPTTGSEFTVISITTNGILKPDSGAAINDYGNWTNSGTFTANSGTVNLLSTSSGGTLTSGGSSFYNLTQNGSGGTYTLQDALTTTNDLTINAGTLDTKSGSNFDIAVAGNWSNSGAFTPRSGTVTFNGSSGQALTGETFYNLTINNSAASPSDSVDVDSSAAVTVTNTLTVTDGQFQPTTASSFKDITITTNGILKPDSSASISLTGNWSNTGTFTANSGTVTLTSTSGSATLTSGGSSFYNLTQNGSGGTYTLQDALATVNNLTITAGTLDVKSGSNFGVTVGGTWSRSGTFVPRNGTLTLTGTSTFSDTMSFYDLMIDSSSNTTTLGAAVTTTHDLTITSGTFYLAGNNLAVGGTFTTGGTLMLNGVETSVTSPSNLTTAGTVSYNNAIPVTSFLLGNLYYNLVATGTDTVTLAADLTTNNNLSIDSGATLILNDFDLAIAGNLVNSGTLTQDADSTITLNGVTQTLNLNSTNVAAGLDVSGSSGTTSLGSNFTVSNILSIAAGRTLALVNYVITLGSHLLTNLGVITEGTGYIAGTSSNLYIADSSFDEDATISLGLDSVYVSLIDQDANLNGQSADTLSGVVVSCPTDSETVTLTETGVATETFRNAGLATALYTGSSSNNNGTLTCANATTITATYTDPQDSGDTRSDTSSATTDTPPTAPSSFSGSADSDTSITWTWTDNANSETGFKLYSSSNVLIATISTANATSYTETALTASTSYTRKLVAYNSAGNSSYSNSDSVTTDAPTGTPTPTPTATPTPSPTPSSDLVPSAFSLVSPSNNALSGTGLPTFSFKKSTETGGSISSYTLYVGDLSFSGIPANGNAASNPASSTHSTETYTAQYFRESDGDDSNDTITVTLKDGSTSLPLPDGKYVWYVKVVDESGNTKTSEERTIHVDRTLPVIKGVTIANSITKTSTSFTTESTSPVLTATLSDTRSLQEATLTLEKATKLLGAVTSYAAQETRTYSLKGTTQRLSFTSKKALLPGFSYRYTITVKDSAGHSTTAKYTLSVLSKKQVAEEVVNSLDAEEAPTETIIETLRDLLPESPVNLVALQEQALLRRQLQAREFKKFFDPILAYLFNGRGIIERNVVAAIVFFGERVNEGTDAIAVAWKSAVPIVRDAKSTLLASLGLTDNVNQLASYFSGVLAKGQEVRVRQGLANRQRIDGWVSQVLSPVRTQGVRLALKARATYEVWLDGTPTKISNLAMTRLSSRSVTVTWDTNHLTHLGKVNYGTSTSYTEEAFEDAGLRDHHEVTLHNLVPKTTYYFEVMNQNGGYVYDAYYAVTTPAESQDVSSGPLVPQDAIIQGSAAVAAYESPEPSAVIVTTLTPGTTLRALREKDGWVSVLLPSGPEVWVQVDSVKLVTHEGVSASAQH